MDRFFVMGGRFVFWVALFAALMLAVAHAFAQPFQVPVTPDNPCGFPVPTPQRTYYTDITVVVSPTATSVVPLVACTPAPLGAGTFPTIRWNKFGLMGWFYCPQPTGKWTTTWGAETWGSLTRHNLTSDASAIASSNDPAQTLNSILASHITVPLADPSLTPVWCPFSTEMINGKPADVVPVTETWHTPATGFGTIYRTVGGKVSGVVVGSKAAPSTLCDCTTQIPFAGQTMCAIANADTTQVTVCRKDTP